MRPVRPAAVLALALAGIACGTSNPRRCEKAMALVQEMNQELRACQKEVQSAFAGRRDWEQVRGVFRSQDLFDVGTPMGPRFAPTFDLVLEGLVAELDKLPRDDRFTSACATRVRKLGHWWMAMRMELQSERARLQAALEGKGDQVSSAAWDACNKAFAVLDATLAALERFELIVAKYAKKLDMLNVSNWG